jgi:hypothetical protein
MNFKTASKNDKPFTLNSHVLERVNDWEKCILFKFNGKFSNMEHSKEIIDTVVK